MNSDESDSLIKRQIYCSICRKKIKAAEVYIYNSKALCEDCYIGIRMPRIRKTHWQYLGSIKSKYLIPSKDNKSK
jgi:hypothetical protein